MDCSAACPNCDRSVAEFPDREDHMTLEQIKVFIDEIRERDIFVERLKWVGGEPLVHPQFIEIHKMLGDAIDEGLIGKVNISTNCVSKQPEGFVNHKKIRWMRSPLTAKKHLSFYWHPEDCGQPTSGFCSHPRVCGMSLSKDGWLPCSPAIMIAGGFDLEKYYRDDVPLEPWGEELCSHCVYSGPRKWRQSHLAFEFTEPTPRWAAALENYASKTGNRLKMPEGKPSPDYKPLPVLQ
jgi:hypothetical protein